jgi:hypothetical protein
MTVAEEIRTLRKMLGENTAAFGARWQKSARAVENWEQGRNAPEPFVLDAIRKLAARRQARDATREEFTRAFNEVKTKRRGLMKRLANR